MVDALFGSNDDDAQGKAATSTQILPANPSLSLPLAPVTGGQEIANIPTDDEIDKLIALDQDKFAAITDDVLASYKTADMGDMSAKITRLVSVSKGFDPKQAKSGSSLVGKMMTIFRNEREQLLSHVKSVQSQIDGIVAELDKAAALQTKRISDLAGLYDQNYLYHETLERKAIQFESWSSQAQLELAKPVDPNDGFAAPKLKALQSKIQRLDNTARNFRNGMTLAKQKAIEIQLTVENARSILQQFAESKTTVIPALKSLLSQYIINMEQKKAIETDNMLQNTLDEAMRANAMLTSENSIAIATRQNTALISLGTIEECQKILDDTAVKIKAIEDAGREDRIKDAARRQVIEGDILKSITTLTPEVLIK